MEDIIHLWDGEKWNGPITDGHIHLDRKGRCLDAAIDFESSELIFLSSSEDNFLEEIKEALSSPLFFPDSFRKLKIIFFRKKILLFVTKIERKLVNILAKFIVLEISFIIFSWLTKD